MPENGVCAIVITFRPPADVIANLKKVRSQTQALFVIDNGSSSESLLPFRAAAREINFQLVENGKNLGIGTALNIGVRAARSEGLRWVAFFDQDSTVTDGFVESMLAEYASWPQKERIGIVAPRGISPDTGAPLHSWPAGDGKLEVAQTSGSMIPLTVFDDVGCFVENLFIDMVDFEYSLRLRRRGYIIVECPTALLMHSAGAPKMHTIFGKLRFTSSNYNAARRYYIQRNAVWMAKVYWRAYPRFLIALLSIRVKDLIKVLLVEEHRIQKVIGSFQGVVDGLAGRMGKRVEL